MPASQCNVSAGCLTDVLTGVKQDAVEGLDELDPTTRLTSSMQTINSYRQHTADLKAIYAGCKQLLVGSASCWLSWLYFQHHCALKLLYCPLRHASGHNPEICTHCALTSNHALAVLLLISLGVQCRSVTGHSDAA